MQLHSKLQLGIDYSKILCHNVRIIRVIIIIGIIAMCHNISLANSDSIMSTKIQMFMSNS